MASLPAYVSLLHTGQSESFDPAIIRSDMERGLAKQRVGNSRVVRKLQVSLLFETREDALAFEDWYFNTIKRVGFFDVKHPLTGAVMPMRFENANIGELTPLTGGYHIASRSVILEYLR
ncbi:hypothetical protein [Comamonas terrae]|uniref:Phage tail protein n=1 Tax=Comamonas terrae TaxID=673548 RepID=A0ABW5URW7_9BURK|nr:hypothetical protein [Comamonas terrae]